MQNLCNICSCVITVSFYYANVKRFYIKVPFQKIENAFLLRLKLLPGTSAKSIKTLWKLLKQNQTLKPRTKQSYQNLGKLPDVFISSWLNRFLHCDQDYFTHQREAHVWVSTVTELLLLPVRSQAHHEGNREEPGLLLLHLLLKWNSCFPALPWGTWHSQTKQPQHHPPLQNWLQETFVTHSASLHNSCLITDTGHSYCVLVGFGLKRWNLGSQHVLKSLTTLHASHSLCMTQNISVFSS